MKKKTLSSTISGKSNQNQNKAKDEKDSFSGYPVYSPGDDIYQKAKEERLDPEEIDRIKDPNGKPKNRKKKDIGDSLTGRGMDVPGSELDDEQEDIGSEDEENNYYSIGGDDHNALDEDRVE